MKKGIVITTSEYTKEWLLECLESVRYTNYPIVIVSNGGYYPNKTMLEFLLQEDTTMYPIDLVVNEENGFELGGIKAGKEWFDEFVHIMDTAFVKDISLFDKLFELPGNVFLTNGAYHYMGKFVTETLLPLPEVKTKEDAIAWELRWLQGDRLYFEPDLPVHTEVFEEKHGRKNMVLENDYMIKWKATWSL